MDHTKRAQALRDVKERHYNCCQAALLPFAEEQGLDHEDICRLAAQFGAGMRRGSVCGAATGGLMALGLLGADEETFSAGSGHGRGPWTAVICWRRLRSRERKKSPTATVWWRWPWRWWMS